MEFAGFLVQTTNKIVALLVVVSDPHSDRRSNASDRVKHKSDQSSIAQTDNRSGIDRIQERTHLSGGEGSRCAFPRAEAWRFYVGRRVAGEHAFFYQKTEEHPECTDILLFTSGRRGKLFYKTGDHERFDLMERRAGSPFFNERKEIPNRPGIAACNNLM